MDGATREGLESNIVYNIFRIDIRKKGFSKVVVRHWNWGGSGVNILGDVQEKGRCGTD